MKLIPTTILSLALLATLSCSGSNSEAAGGAPSSTATPGTPAATKASPPAAAPASTYSGPSLDSIKAAGVEEVAKIKSTLFTDTTQLLKGITDLEGAKAALPNLEAIVGRLKPLQARESELKNGSVKDKLAYAKSALNMLGDATGLSNEIARLAEIPGVTEMLQSSIDQLIEYFTPGK